MSRLIDSWWEQWRSQDYSWVGLANKEWSGWLWSQDEERAVRSHEVDDKTGFIDATLQHYWWDQRSKLIHSPDKSESYTIVHLPLHWKDGTSTKKEKYHLSLVKVLQKKFANHNKSNSVRDYGDRSDYRVQLCGAVLLSGKGDHRLDFEIFKQDCDINGKNLALGPTGNWASEPISVSPEITLSNSLLIGNQIFSRFTFSQNLIASRCIFSGLAYFDRVKFEGATNFDGSIFLGTASFIEAEFHAYTGFEKAIFADYAAFSKSKFRKESHFHGSSFFGAAIFNHAEFFGDINFSGSAFAEGMTLDGSSICASIELTDTHFEGPCSLSGTKGSTNSAECRQRISLSRVEPENAASGWTGELVAPVSASLNTRSSLEAIYANGAIFVDYLDLMTRDVLRPSIFEGSRFYGRILCHGSKLNQRIGFHGSKFAAIEHLSRVRMLRKRKIEILRLRKHLLQYLNKKIVKKISGSSKFLLVRSREVDARGMICETQSFSAPSSLKLLEASRIVQALPSIYALGIEERRRVLRQWDKRWESRRERNADLSDKHFEKIEASFRTLKQAMEDSRSRLAEGLFFRFELRARLARRDSEVGSWERAFSRTYSVLSDYGSSIILPIAWFGVVLLLFSAIYFHIATFSADENRAAYLSWEIIDSNLWDAVRFSMSRMFPFGAMDGTAVTGWPWKESLLADPAKGLFIRILATIQSLIALILSFLFALSVRRRFQIS